MITSDSIRASFDMMEAIAFEDENHIDDLHLTPAAVLIGLIDSDDSTGFSILLTTRTQHLHHHPGQISLPGGRLDATDSSLMHTALRETHEEIGVSNQYIDMLGGLQTYKSVTGFIITPFVAYIRPGYDLKPDPFEVDDVFSVPLSTVLNPLNHRKILRDNAISTENEQHDFYFEINYGTKRIWGVTAGILVSFYKRLREKHPLYCELVPQFKSQ